MAGTRISDATLRSALQGTESLPIVDTGLDVGRTTIDAIAGYVSPDLSQYVYSTDIKFIYAVTELPGSPDSMTLYLITTD